MIMTSNIGADRITSQDPFGFVKRDEEVGYEKMKEMLISELERYFRPEFINRIDEVVVFRKLTHDDLLNILDLEVAKVDQRLAEHGLHLQLADDAKELLLEKGTDEKFGARPLRRTISSLIEDPLSEDILRNKYAGCGVIEVLVEPDPDDEEQKKLKFDGRPAPPPSEADKKEKEEAVAGTETT
jgi:ATP-dependent Clp protease ATP-binding subunit ClpC